MSFVLNLTVLISTILFKIFFSYVYMTVSAIGEFKNLSQGKEHQLLILLAEMCTFLHQMGKQPYCMCHIVYAHWLSDDIVICSRLLQSLVITGQITRTLSYQTNLRNRRALLRFNVSLVCICIEKNPMYYIVSCSRKEISLMLPAISSISQGAYVEFKKQISQLILQKYW